MSIPTAKVKFLAFPMMILIFSSSAFAGFGAPLDRIDCHAVRAKDLLPGGQTYSVAIEATKDINYVSYAKDYICGEGRFLSMMNEENKAMALMMKATSSDNEIIQKIGKAFSEFRPDQSLAPWNEYCAGKLTLAAALNQVNQAAPHELEFGRKLDQILGSDSSQAHGCENSKASVKYGEQ
ncbi:hypothetical protein ACLSU7_05780 [Bdellovibrio sp. HCB185ZH]|uniref:hypothetical protein n=1 Tax=Bdellovibrio sp. HCB185ZH TaxID=3394235 RepID=UPI0039A5FAAC